MAADIQVMLVSAQAAPNLLAAADTELKPQRAVLAASATMRDRAGALEAVLGELGIAAECLALHDEHHPQRIAEDLLSLAARVEGKQVHLNVTGGTKLMALTALSVAETAGWTAFYVDVDTDHVVWLGREAPPPRKLNEAVRLRHYLGAYGIRIDGQPHRLGASAAQRDFVENVLLYYERYLPALPLLNGALQRAESRGALSVELTEIERDSRSLDELLDLAQEKGLVRREDPKLAVGNEAARDFLKGGWLEQHVFDTVTGLGGELAVRDRAVNLTVHHRDVQSELDVAFLCRNRLHVIECKTGNLQAGDGSRANDALFKLAENARRLGGLATRGMLVSYRSLRDAEQRLARLLQVETVHGRDVPRLREKLLHWCRRP